MSVLARWRDRRTCFHHDIKAGLTWIESQLIDMGRGKLYRCSMCGRTWIR